MPFATQFLAALEDDDLRCQKVERALETARQYGWDRVADSFFDLYEELYESMQGGAAGLAPTVSSSPASRLQKLLIDGVSKSAGSIFSLLSR
jgi:hypothetical protein